MYSFDIIVIGAGPAGSAAAAWAARKGATVALIDKARFPRQKLCGGAVTLRSQRLYAEIFGEDIPFDPANIKESAEFWANAKRLSLLTGVPPIYLAMRWNFDAQMQARAVALGAKDYSGASVRSITGTTLTLETGAELKCKVLIGADGVKSQVARVLFGKSFSLQTIGFALEIEAPASKDPASEPLRIDFDAAEWGYGWRFPKQESTTIGVGGLLRENPDLKQHLETYIETLGSNENLNIKGHHLPFGYFLKTPGKGATLLAGDAAGLVDPITGEGIAYALLSGKLGADAALEAIKAGKADSALRLYKRKLRPTHRNLRIARLLRQILFMPRFKQIFYNRFRDSKTLSMSFMRLLAGEVEYPALMGKALLRLPSLLFAAPFHRKPSAQK